MNCGCADCLVLLCPMVVHRGRNSSSNWSLSWSFAQMLSTGIKYISSYWTLLLLLHPSVGSRRQSDTSWMIVIVMQFQRRVDPRCGKKPRHDPDSVGPWLGLSRTFAQCAKEAMVEMWSNWLLHVSSCCCCCAKSLIDLGHNFFNFWIMVLFLLLKIDRGLLIIL